jgi:flagellar biosynthesis/type III secretory pathway chaperone
MLALLDRQQEQVKARSAAEIFQSISLIQAQAAAIQAARQQREQCRAAAALACRQTENAPFADLIPLLPPDYRPLLQALVDENNQLLGRVRQRARQNHVLLRRSVELMQELLRTLFPARQTSVYNGNGRRRGQVLDARPLYNATG